MVSTSRAPAGWLPTPAQRRWGEFQRWLVCWPAEQPWPPERVAELVAITTAMDSEHAAVMSAVLDMRIPWAVLKRDMNRLAATLGSGWPHSPTGDLDALDATVRRRLLETTNPADDGDGEVA
ncbi:MAG: hypothetical protein AB7H92_17625 [Microbacteriaceae bacterium]